MHRRPGSECFDYPHRYSPAPVIVAVRVPEKGMMKLLIALLLVPGALITTSCYGSPDGGGRNSKKVTRENPLAGVAEVARRFGNRVPADHSNARRYSS